MKQVTLSIIGCGNRSSIYAKLASENPSKYKLVAAADLNIRRAEKIRDFSNNPDFKVFDSADALFNEGKISDIMIIGTQDQFHYEPCKKALELGYDVLLEKPISPSIQEIVDLQSIAEKLGRKLQVCYVLRYTPFYKKVKAIIESGILGDIVSINANEGVLPWHQAHSFVRGKWCRVEDSTPMIVAKCCHDTDIIQWLLGKKCESVSSYGALTYFVEKNAPEGAPKRCTDGCPHADNCEYNALRYASDMREPWLELVYDNFEDATSEEIIEWLKTSDYSKCVYRCDNNVVDHQIVAMEFEGKVTANLTMTAFETGRHIEVFGSKGVLKGGQYLKRKTGCDVIVDLWNGETISYTVSEKTEGDHHMGGDEGLMGAFYDEMVGEGNPVSSYIQSHVMAYAAEESRISNQKIELDEFVKSIINK